MSIFKRKTNKIAIVQSIVIQDDRGQNITSAMNLVDKAAEQGAEIICLTEAFGTGINWLNLKEMAESVPEGPITGQLQEKAKQHKIHLIAGILEKDGNDIFDTAVIIDPEGTLLGKYRRWFLWTGETNYITPGKPINCIHTNFGKVGLIIGYDINFPETCRRYFQEQVDLIVCLGAIFEEFSSSTVNLCRARATENHCYFVLASALGEHQFANKRFMGNSMVTCDPTFLLKNLKVPMQEDISILARAGREETVLLQDLFIDDMAQSRKGIPHYQDLSAAISV